MSAKGLFFILFVFLFIVSGSGYESGGDDKSENKKPPQENVAEKTETAGAYGGLRRQMVF